MRANFNRTGQDRKDMVAALFDITGIAPKYKGVFSQAYQIGEMEVTRDGAIEFGDMPKEEVKKIMDALITRSIWPESMPEELNDVATEQVATGVEQTETAVEQTATEPEQTENTEESAETAEPDEPEEAATAPEEVQTDTPRSAEQTIEGTALSVSMPRDFFTDEALANLRKIIESKGALMKAAFKTSDLPILEEEDKVSFPWFTLETDQDANAYNHFVSAICNMAKNQTRITAKEKAADNEKYAFRCFLLRLGFIGKEYKEERKVLLRNLSGSSAFKNTEKEDQAS